MDPDAARPTSLPLSSLSRYSSKIRASCGNAARGDLCGGYRATGIPTATRSLARLDDGTPSLSALNMLRTVIAEATGAVS
jgi:hypothetical protein